MNNSISIFGESENSDPAHPDKSYEINKECEDLNTRVDKEIGVLLLRQKEIQFFITGLNSSNRYADNEIQLESKKTPPNYKLIQSYKFQIKDNLELIATFYKIYQQLEETKAKYYGQLSSNSLNKHKLLLEIQLKLKSGMGNDDPFTILANYIKNNNMPGSSSPVEISPFHYNDEEESEEVLSNRQKANDFTEHDYDL